MRLDHLLSKEDAKANHELSKRGKLVKKLLFNFEGASERRPLKIRYGGLAQLGEHLLCKQGVKGSIPLISTKGAHSSGG